MKYRIVKLHKDDAHYDCTPSHVGQIFEPAEDFSFGKGKWGKKSWGRGAGTIDGYPYEFFFAAVCLEPFHEPEPAEVMA
jgi:hypothetical protein